MEVVYNYADSKDVKNSRVLYVSQIDSRDVQEENERRSMRVFDPDSPWYKSDYKEFNIPNRLDELGDQGWELVSTHRLDIRLSTTDTVDTPVVIYTLKRPYEL